MREFNAEDKWSATDRELRSKHYQQFLGMYCQTWKDEDANIDSNDDLVDAIIDEINNRNKADLFDFNRMYLDPNERNVINVLNEDTRHQMGRVLAKGNRRPNRRLQGSLVDFYMWIDLAMKCREARKIATDNPTKD